MCAPCGPAEEQVEVVLVKGEKKSACAAIWSAVSAARGTSIIVPIEGRTPLLPH